METHTDTSDPTMAISTDPAKMTVELLMIRGFDSGQQVLYLSTEASDPVARTGPVRRRSPDAPGGGPRAVEARPR